MSDSWNQTSGSPGSEAADAATEKGTAQSNIAIGAAATSKWVQPAKYDYTAFQSDEALAQFDGAMRIYEWDEEEFGDVGPKFPELEKELFGDPNDRGHAGLDFSK